MPRKQPSVQLTCETCGAVFTRWASQAKRSERNYCSAPCRSVGHRNRTQLVCDHCGQTFERAVAEVKRRSGRGSFCSRACYDAAQVAQPHVYRKRGRRHAHRVIAEEKIGRPLRPGEIVHHIDRNKHNNDPTNLEVLPSQREHALEHVAEMHQRRREKRRSA